MTYTMKTSEWSMRKLMNLINIFMSLLDKKLTYKISITFIHTSNEELEIKFKNSTIIVVP